TEGSKFILTDHLGSVDVVTDLNGNPIVDMSFGAFGNRREPTTWVPPVTAAEAQLDHQKDRYEFTHQEMLDNVALIHMNGRVYDPNLGRFLSVDPVFEFPTNTQSLNPYSYVLNNPLSMTDPTGYAAAACPNGSSTACPDELKAGQSVSVTKNTTAHDIDSRIAVHGQTTITTTKEANGNTVQTASGNGFHMGETAEVSVDSHGGNGQENSQQGAGSLYKTTMGQGGGTSPAAQAVPTQPTDKTDNQQQHTVTVEYVKGQDGNPAGHAVISVDERPMVGLEQKKDSAAAAAEDKTTPGEVRSIDPKREVLDKAVIRINSDTATKIQKFLDNAEHSPPDYNLYHSNCAQFCEAALRAGGMKNVPNDLTPKGLVSDLNGSPNIIDYIHIIVMPLPFIP
ncbi:MAG: RHS repeat domain-containing protein, partial [Ktedonobacteraceae bacterium]